MNFSRKRSNKFKGVIASGNSVKRWFCSEIFCLFGTVGMAMPFAKFARDMISIVGSNENLRKMLVIKLDGQFKVLAKEKRGC